LGHLPEANVDIGHHLRRSLIVGAAVAVMMGTVASTHTASASDASTPTAPTVASGPELVARTELGNVGYRVVGSGPTLVLIMGYSGTMQTWDPHFIDTLALHFRVVVFDNAGIGKTATLHPLTIDAMADQTSSLITTLHLGRTDVLGWSMGTMIAEALAIRHPGQVDRLVLCAAFPGLGNAVQPSQKDVAALTGSNAAAAQADLFPADQSMAAEAFNGSLLAYPSTSPASTSVTTAQKSAVLAWFDGRDPSGRRANRISVPTLVADGTHDRIDATANDRDVAGEIRGARLLLYPDAGHAFLFQEGETFAYEVRTFLASAPKHIDLAVMRQQYLGDYRTLSELGKDWVSGLKSLTSKSSAEQLARIDLREADVQTTFDDDLRGFAAQGKLGSSITAFTDADENVARDILALGAQSDPKVKKWTTTITADGKVVVEAENAMRRLLGLSPLPTTTTTVKKS
jgi:pimeloyl-ACP methyl ester carboxylesterase